MVYELVTWLSISFGSHSVGARSMHIARIFRFGKLLYNRLKNYGCTNKIIIKVSGG